MKSLVPATTDFSNQEINVMDDRKIVMSNLFNAFFSTLVLLPQTVLTAAQEDFSSHLSESSILGKDFHLNFLFHSISPAYIESLLGKIKSNKSCGPDNITPKILKLSTPALAVPLTNLLNPCIATSRWPNDWKLSNVTPVFKKGDELLMLNYRPIRILSAIPKIMEKVMFDQLHDTFQLSSPLTCLGFCVVTHVVLLLLK